MDFIRGERFIEMADFTFAPKNARDDDYTRLQNTLDLGSVKSGDIIYTHTFYVHDLFELLRDFDKTVKVITHNCDMNVDFPPPDCVSMWFSQNVNIIHPRVQSIPIGLQNRHWNKYGDKDAMILAQLKQPRNYRNLLYVNHNVNTNPKKRSGIYETFRGKPWATCEYRNKNFARVREYYDDIYNHKFVICPEGNGIDTHRIWECLYLGTIPIVEDNINNEFYSNLTLPIIRIKNWIDINKEYLSNLGGDLDDWDWRDILDFEFWKDKIRNT